MTSASSSQLPVVAVSRGGAQRLRDGLPWVFRNDLRRIPESIPGPLPFVRVTDERGNQAAVALFAARGAIALRRWGPPGTPVSDDEIVRRLDLALDLRTRLLPGVTAVRLVHAEADHLPGVFVDRYGDALVVQHASSSAELMMPLVVRTLRERLKPSLVVRRDDGSMRDLEELPRVVEVLHGGPETRVTYSEGDVRFEADLKGGHKTGSYLDQRDNHVLAGTLARGRSLDVFSNEGGFGVAMALRSEHTICVEQDPESVARLMRNAELNNVAARVDGRAANAFDVMRTLDETGARFESIVVDPPALAKRAGPLESALRGYFELNRRAFRLAAPGAFLHTYSCSGRVTPDIFLSMVLEAAQHSRRRAQVLMHRTAGPDHPGLLGMPEAEYLKGLVLRVE